MAYRLVARSGPIAGNEYKLEREEIFIGRDLNNDVVVNDPEVSRRHARLFLKGSTYILEDLGSTNGTMVNGQRLVGPYSLSTGSLITLGENITLVFEAEPTIPEGEATIVSAPDANATMRANVAAVQQPVYEPPQPQNVYAPPVEQQPYVPPQPEPYIPQPPPPQQYVGQIPEPSYAAPATPKKKFPVWLIIIIIVLLLLCCILIVVLGIYADSQCYFGLLPSSIVQCAVP